MVEYARKQKREKLQAQRVELEQRLAKIRAKEAKQREVFERGDLPMRKRPVSLPHCLIAD